MGSPKSTSVMSGAGVYMLYCHENEKAYIGSSNHINRRFAHHRCYLRANKHGNQHLQNAWNRYGEDSFSFGILHPCEDGEQLQWEQYYLDVWFESDMTFNRHPDAKSPKGNKWTEEERLAKSIAMKANPPFKGRNHTPESKALLSAAHKAWLAVNDNTFLGKKHSDEAKSKMSEAQKGHTRSRGRKLSDSAKALISAANTGRVQSDETKAKISAATKGENNPRFGARVSQAQKDKAAATLAMRTPEEVTASREKLSNAIRALPPKTQAEKDAINLKKNATRAATRAAMSPAEIESRREAHTNALRATRAKNKEAMTVDELAAKRQAHSANIKAALALRTPEEWKRIAEKKRMLKLAA